MKIYLIRSKEFKEEAYRDVLNLLQQYLGPLQFIAVDEAIELTSQNKRIYTDEEDFRKIIAQTNEVSFNMIEPDWPKEESVMSWATLFDVCNQFRTDNNLSSADVVYLLTDMANENNWFSTADENALNGYIHTANWDYFFPGSDRRFPISYEITTLILEQLMFESYEELTNHMHHEAKGCMNDFCQDKKQIIYKMRTADICADCMNLLHEKNVSPAIIGQSLSIMEGVRKNMLFKERFKFVQLPSKMQIRGRTKKIFLTDLDLEIHLTPLEKSVYLLFLNHLEGIKISHVQDYEQELFAIYSRVANRDTNEEIRQSINDLANPMHTSLEQKLAKIKKKFKDAAGNEMAKHYYIHGHRGEVKKISLDRSLITIVD